MNELKELTGCPLGLRVLRLGRVVDRLRGFVDEVFISGAENQKILVNFVLFRVFRQFAFFLHDFSSGGILFCGMQFEA